MMIDWLLLAIHLLAVSIAAGLPLFIGWGQWCDKSLSHRRLYRFALVVATGSLLIGVATGVLQVAWAERGNWAEWREFPTGLWWRMAGELGFYLVALAIWGWTLGPSRASRWPRWSGLLLGLVIATDLLYHFPPLMSWLVETPLPLDLDTFRLFAWADDPARVLLVAHVMLACVAIGGIASMGLAVASAPPHTGLCRFSARVALSVTVVQLPLGLTLTLWQPREVQDAMLGESLWLTLPFAGGVLASMGLVFALAMVSLGETKPAAVRQCVLWLLAVQLLMAAALHGKRELGRPPVGNTLAAIESAAAVTHQAARPRAISSVG